MDYGSPTAETVWVPPQRPPEPPRPQKKRGPGGDDGYQPRWGKRGKYTSVACEECKEKKTKCNPAAAGDAGCKRCVEAGIVCIYTRGSPQASKRRVGRLGRRLQELQQPQQTPQVQQDQRIEELSNEVAELRRKLVDLDGVVNGLKEARSQSRVVQAVLSPSSQAATLGQTPSSASQKEGGPSQPHFIGPTRPVFGLVMGERALTRMGIPVFESLPPSGVQSPTGVPKEVTTPRDFFLSCGLDEVTRLLELWRDEVEMVYPFIDFRDRTSHAQQVLDCIRTGRLTGEEPNDDCGTGTDALDIDLVKVALSTGMVLDSCSKNEPSSAIVESVERKISRISGSHFGLKRIQLPIMLSIYYFHSDEELLSWRSIGVAAREALEMGLHRKDSLFDNFKDPESRRQATRVFWCVYVLDRRWSFGTSLSFALVDRDIDPELPEPDAEHSYLKCMAGYGRLCSKIWDAIPPFGSSPQSTPEHVVAMLDASTQSWLESIPSHLQLRHLRLGLAPRSQPRSLHRLRALLYLRGNHVRSLIYRHYVLNSSNIARNPQNAWLVVDIAQDSVQVLMHLSATTEIYKRQQNAFNYFLLSALAIIFLAVCNAPDVFTGPCRKSFLDAVELVRGFSRHSTVSRRLWQTIRGLLPRLRRLGLQRNGEGQDSHHSHLAVERVPRASLIPIHDRLAQTESVLDRTQPFGDNNAPHIGGLDMNGELVPDMDMDISGSIPDIFQMGSDLASLFDAFGHGYQQLQDQLGSHSYATNEPDFLNEMDGEISRRFQSLI